MRYNKITQKHIIEAFAEFDRTGKVAHYAKRHNLSAEYLKNKMRTFEVKDDYLANPSTPLSACGGLSPEARL